jgi:folate-binding protein YgfZ
MTDDYKALTESAGLLDFSNRGRLCLLGADRQNFLNGQVTNNLKNLRSGQGCYAALANNKAKMTSDLFIYILEEEILLDFEPGLSPKVSERLEKFIIADDVQITDASSAFAMFTVQGPKAIEVCEKAGWPIPKNDFEIVAHNSAYIARTPRLRAPGVDVFYPRGDDSWLKSLNLPVSGIDAYETVRIEQGVPRFGIDMNEETLVSEALDERAISYSKGCYIGQEVIARIRTYGQVAKSLRGLKFEPGAAAAKAGEKIFHDGKEVGWITSATLSPKLNRPIALGYVRKECNQIGARLLVNNSPAEIVPLPFQAS